MSVKFQALRRANVTDLAFKTPKIMSKSCFQHKEMLMAKRRKVLTFHSWLNLAMEDVFLGRLSFFVHLFVYVIALDKL